MFQQSTCFILLDLESKTPVFAKYDDKVAYLPVFETRKSAETAAINLRVTKGRETVKGGGEYIIAKFSWSDFRKWYDDHEAMGIMLFVYPMAPHDYGVPSCR